MNKDQVWIAAAFLAELEGMKFSESEPLYKSDRRLKLAETVLTEIPGDDLDELALGATAEAYRDLWHSPTDPDAIEHFLEVRRAHLDVLKSIQPPDTPEEVTHKLGPPVHQGGSPPRNCPGGICAWGYRAGIRRCKPGGQRNR